MEIKGLLKKIAWLSLVCFIGCLPAFAGDGNAPSGQDTPPVAAQVPLSQQVTSPEQAGKESAASVSACAGDDSAAPAS
jgi:hypothetical protein